MTFENALKRIKAKFEEIDASKLADMAVQVTLTDEDCGGTLYFKSVDGKVDVEGYDYRDNDAVIDIDRKAFSDILSGKLTLDKAIEKGLATAKGNFDKLATLNDAIPKYVAPSRKAAAVKETAEEKKETVKAAPAKAETVKAAPAKTAVQAEPAKAAVKTEPAKKPAAVKKAAATVKSASTAKKTTTAAKKTASKSTAKKA